MTIYPVLLAGGSGTRLWPLSREHHPKQFLAMIGKQSMLQDTLARLDGMEGATDPLIVCNEAHRFLVVNQMREVGKRPLSILVEPAGRNTAPALTLAALRLQEIGQPPEQDPVMLVMPADAVVRDRSAFHAAVSVGASFASEGQMVTCGVVPDAPETGYGYIRKGESLGDASRVSGFVEKPDLETAKAYLETGEYLWNSGVFMMRTSVWLSELERHRPDIAEACRAACSDGQVDGDFYRPSADEFAGCPSESIDYAVMEKVAEDVLGTAISAGDRRTGCVVVPLDAGWSDLGAWSSIRKEREQDSDGNVIEGDVYAHSTEGALLLARQRLLAVVGMKDVVVVETGDAVLVAHRDHVEEVKEIVLRLGADERSEREVHPKVDRPWGTYEILDAGEGFQVKRLTLNPGASVSLQRHSHRAEHWVVVKGTAKVTRGDEVFLLAKNESTYVPKGTKHRLGNPGADLLEVIEVQSGSYLGEEDIVRFQDDYNRHVEG